MGYKLNVVKLGKRILLGQKSITPTVDVPPQKTKTFYDLPESEYLEKSGEFKRNQRIEDFIRAVREDSSTALHSTVVLKNGKIISEFYETPYKKGEWHSAFSASKTVTALAIGVLVDQKELSVDDKIVELLHPKKYGYKPKEYQKSLTVLDLLTMNSKVDFAEAHAVTNKNWLKCYMQAKLKKDGFNYNSLNSYVLSVIVKEKTGKNLSEFLQEKIFSHLGINRFFWEKDEKGYEKGGWGLYISTEDMAKLGQLFLNGGKWKGKQIISPIYLAEMTENLRLTPKSYGKYNYGYHVWHHESEKIHLFNGLMGQNVFILPEKDLVVAVNAGNASFFQNDSLCDLVERHLVREEKYLPKKQKEREENVLFGGVYEYDVESARKIGFLPAVQAVFQNNFGKSITGFKLDINNEIFELKGEDVKIPISFKFPTEFIYFQNGEKYVCRALVSGKGNTISIKVHFVETPVVKIFDISFGNKIYFTHRETPGSELIKTAQKTLLGEKKVGLTAKLVKSKLAVKTVNGLLCEKIEVKTEK